MVDGGHRPAHPATEDVRPGAPSAAPHPTGPIIALPSESAAAASRPDQPLDERYHAYEANPAPWWIGLVWIVFLVFGASYLIVNLLD
jgi:hypothetical protein